jgi:DNA-directed RNA polymerase subunit omega
MARVTTEDCVSLIPNRFELVIYACRRARDIIAGSQISVEREDDKDTVIALREIADKTIDLGDLRSSIIENLQKYSPVAESDIEENDAVPLKDDASEISFDNFERENASEKKRKKIYVTESDIQKLIENNRKEMQDKPEVDSEKVDIKNKE